MSKLIKRFRRDEKGAALVEYGLLVGLIAAVCIGVVTITGTDVRAVFTAINAALATIPGV
jgi:pilus assembly protein Flp/PilA